METNEIIKQRRLELKMTLKDVAKRIGVAESTISRYETKDIGNMGLDKLSAIAKALDCSPGYLMGWTGKNIKSCEMIPILSRYVPDEHIFYSKNIIGYVEIAERMEGDYFAIKVVDDSMSPRMAKNDVIVVRRQDYVESGDVAVLTIGDDITVRKVIYHDEGLSLVPLNPIHEPKFYTGSDLKERMIKIIGKAVELRAKF